MPSPHDFQTRPWPWLAMRGIAWAAGLFSMVLCILLIADFVRLRNLDPLNHPQLLALRDQLAASDGGNEALVEQIRGMDLMARKAYFTGQEQRIFGGWLLLGGVVTTFLALKLSVLWNPQRPLPRIDTPPDPLSAASRLRQVLAGLGIFLVVLTLFFTFSVESDLAALLASRTTEQPPGDGSPAAPAFHGMEELRTQWPGLRGPGGRGIAASSDAPVQWDGASGEGILWKSPVPKPGFNSPVVWDNRIFLAGADEEQFEVYAFDAADGTLRWTYAVPSFEGSPAHRPKVSEDTGFAAATGATDGYRVFMLFATGDLVCLDFDGQLVWGRNLGAPDNPYGMGSSLLTDGRLLFVQYDHEKEARVMALDNATGDEVWQNTERKGLSWATPLYAETPHGPRLILNGAKTVDAYDPATGKALWSIECLGGEVAPSPAYDAGLVLAANEYAQATLLRLGPEGAEAVWEYDELLPEIASPLLTGNYAYIFTTGGEGACIDASTGEALWEEEFKDMFSSSPVRVGDRVYVTDQGGTTYILEIGPAYKLVASPKIGEGVFATPAFVAGRIYLRSTDHLYGIGTP